MPANLPPQYFEAERSYRQARTIPEKIEAVEKMLSIMPKHKGTERLRAELRTKIARLSQEEEHRTGDRVSLYLVRREGAGQAALVGLPNAGKSRLLARLTQASPPIAPYPFTTKFPLPGMMPWENIQIQIVDLPPLTDRHTISWLPQILKRADLLLLVMDLSSDSLEQMKIILNELAKIGLNPARREGESPEGGIFPKVLVVANKNDLEGASDHYLQLQAQYGKEFPLVSVSAAENNGIEELKQKLFSSLEVIRVYTKAPGEEPDLAQPVILKKGSTIEEVAASIHKDFHRKLKYAQVWGSGKFDGQKVSRQYILKEGDIVELHA